MKERLDVEVPGMGMLILLVVMLFVANILIALNLSRIEDRLKSIDEKIPALADKK